jgi:hypothetical protein
MTMDAVRAGSSSRMVRADAATAEVRERVFSILEVSGESLREKFGLKFFQEKKEEQLG